MKTRKYIVALLALMVNLSAFGVEAEINGSKKIVKGFYQYYIGKVYPNATSEQSEIVPLPANCKVLKSFNIDYENGGGVGFNLIDFDKDARDYEILEYKQIGYDGKILKRGILKAAQFSKNDKKRVYVYGIELNKIDLNDYSPKGMLIDHFNSEGFYQLFKSTLSLKENNGALRELPNDIQYINRSYYPEDLELYKMMLGIE